MARPRFLSTLIGRSGLDLSQTISQPIATSNLTSNCLNSFLYYRTIHGGFICGQEQALEKTVDKTLNYDQCDQEDFVVLKGKAGEGGGGGVHQYDKALNNIKTWIIV